MGCPSPMWCFFSECALLLSLEMQIRPWHFFTDIIPTMIKILKHTIEKGSLGLKQNGWNECSPSRSAWTFCSCSWTANQLSLRNTDSLAASEILRKGLNFWVPLSFEQLHYTLPESLWHPVSRKLVWVLVKSCWKWSCLLAKQWPRICVFPGFKVLTLRAQWFCCNPWAVATWLPGFLQSSQLFRIAPASITSIPSSMVLFNLAQFDIQSLTLDPGFWMLKREPPIPENLKREWFLLFILQQDTEAQWQRSCSTYPIFW